MRGTMVERNGLTEHRGSLNSLHRVVFEVHVRSLKSSNFFAISSAAVLDRTFSLDGAPSFTSFASARVSATDTAT